MLIRLTEMVNHSADCKCKEAQTLAGESRLGEDHCGRNLFDRITHCCPQDPRCALASERILVLKYSVSSFLIYIDMYVKLNSLCGRLPCAWLIVLIFEKVCYLQFHQP